MWGIHHDNKVVGFQHGLEKSSQWDQDDTRVLFLTEGIIMRQAMKTPEFELPLWSCGWMCSPDACLSSFGIFRYGTHPS